MKRLSFIQKCLTGKAKPTEIDDYIERWHRIKEEIPLYEYLGMTRKEYGNWLLNPDIIESIILNHKEK